NDGEPDSVTVNNYWFHYRPQSCSLDPADVISLTASAKRSTLNSDNKYPEYHRVWQDGALRVLAIFAKYQAGATSDSDAGIQAYNRFVEALRQELPAATTTPAQISNQPGVAIPDITFHADGEVIINVLLIDSVPL